MFDTWHWEETFLSLMHSLPNRKSHDFPSENLMRLEAQKLCNMVLPINRDLLLLLLIFWSKTYSSQEKKNKKHFNKQKKKKKEALNLLQVNSLSLKIMMAKDGKLYDMFEF